MPIVEADLRAALRVQAFEHVGRRAARDRRRRATTPGQRRDAPSCRSTRRSYRDLVRRALDEDVGAGDITTDATVSADAAGARRLSRQGATACSPGSTSRSRRSGSSNPAVDGRTSRRRDGDRCARRRRGRRGRRRRRARCSSAERTALNFLQRLSGIATLRARSSSTPPAGASRSSTRARRRRRCARSRSTPCAPAAATNHRVGLYDAILIKDNHMRLAGGVAAAVERPRRERPGPADRDRGADASREVDEALAAGADIILLDNLSHRRHPRGGAPRARAARKIEISGGVTLDRMPELAATGADFVSVGALTHSAPAVDISFEIEPHLSDATSPLPAISPTRSIARAPRLGRLGSPRRCSFRRSDRPTTSRRARRAAPSDERGAWSIADAQTAGRGRRGRAWFSPPGSGLVRVGRADARRGRASTPMRATTLLTLAAGVALPKASRRRPGSRADLKWPNDLLRRPPQARRHPRRRRRGAIGHGSRCGRARLRHQRGPGGVSAGAAAIARRRSKPSWAGRRSRGACCAETLAALARRYDDLLAGRFDAILDAWRAPCAVGERGARVDVDDAAGRARPA